MPATFVLAAVTFWTRVFGPRLFTTTNPGDASAQVREAGFVLAVGLAVAGPLLVFGVAEATLQTVALATAYREGRDEPDARRALPRAFGAGMLAFLVAGLAPLASFGVMMLASLVAEATPQGDSTAGVLAALGGVGLFAGLVVAAWAVGAYALAPAAALRGDGARAACRRSRRLMKGEGAVPSGYGTIWAVYGVLFLAALAESSGVALVDEWVPFERVAPGGGLFAEALSLGLPFLVAWTLLPLWGTAVAVIDGERRVRKEGYDVELLARG